MAPKHTPKGPLDEVSAGVDLLAGKDQYYCARKEQFENLNSSSD